MPRKKREQLAEDLSPEVISKTVLGLRKFLELDEENDTPASWYLDTGNLALNYIVSMRLLDGGFPGGKTTELFGEPSTGKTLLIDKAGASIQKRGGTFIMNDVENRWDKDFARFNGVNINTAIHLMPETVEEFTLQTREILTNYPGIYLIALDSVAALLYEKEMKDLDEGKMTADQGGKAKRLKFAARALRTKIRETGSILLVANHVISNPNSPNPNFRTTPGGRGTPYQAVVRVEMSHVEQIVSEKRKRPLGARLRCKITKNSIAPPFGECILDVYWRNGIHPYSGLLDLMKDMDIVQEGGGWYTWKDIKFRSYNLPGVIQEHPGILEDSLWREPYFLQGGQYLTNKEIDQDEKSTT